VRLLQVLDVLSAGGRVVLLLWEAEPLLLILLL